MRFLIALAIFLMLAGSAAAEADGPPKVATGDFSRFDAIISITSPLELEISFTGELFLAPGVMRIVATNSVTNEETWVIADRNSSQFYLVYPDTLNGVSKAVAEGSLVWKLLESGISRSGLCGDSKLDCSELEATEIGQAKYIGTHFEVNDELSFDFWWDTKGDPKRLVFYSENSNAQFDFQGFEHGVEFSSELLGIAEEFSIRQAAADEKLNPFQL